MGSIAKINGNLPGYANKGRRVGDALLDEDPTIELGGMAALVDELDDAEDRVDIMRCKVKLDCLKAVAAMKKERTSFTLEDLRSFLESMLATIRRHVKDPLIIQRIAQEMYAYEMGHVKFNRDRIGSTGE